MNLSLVLVGSAKCVVPVCEMLVTNPHNVYIKVHTAQ